MPNVAHDEDVIFTQDSLIGFIKAIKQDTSNTYHFVSITDMLEKQTTNINFNNDETEIAETFSNWGTTYAGKICIINTQYIKDTNNLNNGRYTWVRGGNIVDFQNKEVWNISSTPTIGTFQVIENKGVDQYAVRVTGFSGSEGSFDNYDYQLVRVTDDQDEDGIYYYIDNFGGFDNGNTIVDYQLVPWGYSIEEDGETLDWDALRAAGRIYKAGNALIKTNNVQCDNLYTRKINLLTDDDFDLHSKIVVQNSTEAERYIEVKPEYTYIEVVPNNYSTQLVTRTIEGTAYYKAIKINQVDKTTETKNKSTSVAVETTKTLMIKNDDVYIPAILNAVYDRGINSFYIYEVIKKDNVVDSETYSEYDPSLNWLTEETSIDKYQYIGNWVPVNSESDYNENIEYVVKAKNYDSNSEQTFMYSKYEKNRNTWADAITHNLYTLDSQTNTYIPVENKPKHDSTKTYLIWDDKTFSNYNYRQRTWPEDANYLYYINNNNYIKVKNMPAYNSNTQYFIYNPSYIFEHIDEVDITETNWTDKVNQGLFFKNDDNYKEKIRTQLSYTNFKARYTGKELYIQNFSNIFEDFIYEEEQIIEHEGGEPEIIPSNWHPDTDNYYYYDNNSQIWRKVDEEAEYNNLIKYYILKNNPASFLEYEYNENTWQFDAQNGIFIKNGNDYEKIADYVNYNRNYTYVYLSQLGFNEQKLKKKDFNTYINEGKIYELIAENYMQMGNYLQYSEVENDDTIYYERAINYDINGVTTYYKRYHYTEDSWENNNNNIFIDSHILYVDKAVGNNIVKQELKLKEYYNTYDNFYEIELNTNDDLMQKLDVYGQHFADAQVEGSIITYGGIAARKSIKGYKVHGAVFNDYAEFRHTDNIAPGYCVYELGNGSLALTYQRLQLGANIVSDTYGFSIGETQYANTPIAVCGRVLAYTWENRESFKPGQAVCSGPNGTISGMTRDEIKEWPDAIIGYVSEIPTYEYWGTDNIKVDNRIWIKVN